jgi:hypothetical protein
MKNSALIVAGIIFSIVTILHFVRYFKGWVILVGQYAIPPQWSVYAGVITGIVALWMFMAAKK